MRQGIDIGSPLVIAEVDVAYVDPVRVVGEQNLGYVGFCRGTYHSGVDIPSFLPLPPCKCVESSVA